MRVTHCQCEMGFFGCGFVACFVFLVAVFFFSHRGIISLACTTNQKLITASASTAEFTQRVNTCITTLREQLRRWSKKVNVKWDKNESQQLSTQVQQVVFLVSIHAFHCYLHIIYAKSEMVSARRCACNCCDFSGGLGASKHPHVL